MIIIMIIIIIIIIKEEKPPLPFLPPPGDPTPCKVFQCPSFIYRTRCLAIVRCAMAAPWHRISCINCIGDSSGDCLLPVFIHVHPLLILLVLLVVPSTPSSPSPSPSPPSTYPPSLGLLTCALYLLQTQTRKDERERERDRGGGGRMNNKYLDKNPKKNPNQTKQMMIKKTRKSDDDCMHYRTSLVLTDAVTLSTSSPSCLPR